MKWRQEMTLHVKMGHLGRNVSLLLLHEAAAVVFRELLRELLRGGDVHVAAKVALAAAMRFASRPEERNSAERAARFKGLIAVEGVVGV